MAHPPVLARVLCAFLAFNLMLAPVLAQAGGGNGGGRVRGAADLERFQVDEARATQRAQWALEKQQRATDAQNRLERKQAALREEDESNRYAVEQFVRMDLFHGLPTEGDEAVAALARRLPGIDSFLRLGSNGTAIDASRTRMFYTVLGESLAVLLHHPDRIRHLGATPTGSVRDLGPFRTPVLPEGSVTDGAALDTRAEQVLTAANTEREIVSRSAAIEGDGILSRLRRRGVRWGLAAVFAGAAASFGAAVVQSSLADPFGDHRSWDDTLIWTAHPGSDCAGSCRTAWEQAIAKAPGWAQDELQHRVMLSPEMAEIDKAESRVFKLTAAMDADGFYVDSAEEHEYRASLQAIRKNHLALVTNVGQWLFLTGQWAEGRESITDTWLAMLLGRHLQWGGYAATAMLAAGLAIYAKDRRRGHVLQKDLLRRMAAGYAEGCRRLGIEPDARIAELLRTGGFEGALATVPGAADPATCATYLGATAVPTRVEAAAAAEEQDEAEPARRASLR